MCLFGFVLFVFKEIPTMAIVCCVSAAAVAAAAVVRPGNLFSSFQTMVNVSVRLHVRAPAIKSGNC